jgi:hypothetical protein
MSLAQAPRVAQAEREFDPATVTTVEGEILEIQRIPRGRRHEGVHVILAMGAERLDVHLGPDSYVDRQTLKLAKGDRVEVKGSRKTLDGSAVIIAQEVRRGDERLVLRDAVGVPAWSRGRR